MGVSSALKRRNPRVLVRRTRGDVSAIGHPLGMSFAAVLAQVSYRRDAAAQRISPDLLWMKYNISLNHLAYNMR
ncbi:hypothetical protein QN277_006418 [Acacia crassicarpa]|uniref:Thiolase C-terminal domain-containing protein n=1 Tax=Acacia crassicarpa TaxID=499986 RepID=A0AAE1ISD8_9FABA|nr:hypothetical protein QN277_006418 [Acacia crassicarpa]